MQSPGVSLGLNATNILGTFNILIRQPTLHQVGLTPYSETVSGALRLYGCETQRLRDSEAARFRDCENQRLRNSF